jgi:DsbC/DsbD-like thiol-disulfide interchange protein/cytochrome c biogenesis protein CcdA
MRLAASATRRALQPDGRASRAPWRNLNAVARVHPGHGQTTAQRITPMQQHLMPSTKLINRLLIALFLIAISALGNWAGAQNVAKSVITTEQVRAELMVHAPQGADAGKTVWVGLQLTHQPEWHTYWKNSGDSGQATTLQWTLPTGVLAGDIAWPIPRMLPIGDLANYGFDGTVLLPVPLTITPDFKPSALNPQLEVKLRASWLVCRLECVPQDGEFVLQLPAHSSTAPNAAAFEAAFAAAPKPSTASARMKPEGRHLLLSIDGLPSELQGKTLEFFPETPEVIEVAATWTQSWQGPQWRARIPLAKHQSAHPDALPLVLVADLAGKRRGWVLQARLDGSWPATAAPANAGVAPATAARLPDIAPTPPANGSLWLALLGALLGGMLLNLMPCVFPVLAIKLMSFTRHADDRRGHRISGLSYSVGVVLSFLALGALMIVLRSAGEQLGWGFQLQSPAVVAALALLFTLIGLNLAGLFEFGQMVPERLATLQAKNPALDAFLSGILAVAIASPCTAPFMGASLGLALGLPAVQALLIFAAIGVGMALPYLAASVSPALARKLPRPGPWMDTFRRAMAFPMFATVVWLVWVLGQQTGIDGAGALLALLVALALVVWSFTLRGRSRPFIAAFSIATFALLAAPLTNDTFLRACRRQATDYTPLWLMRQAGRYLPEYKATRAKAGSFMGLATNTDYATEVTLQPLERFPLDAAILFSDILTVPDAMGLGLTFAEGEGPALPNRCRARRGRRGPAGRARHGQAALCV